MNIGAPVRYYSSDCFLSHAEVAEKRGGRFELEPLRSPATSA
jgi:hypothetical protein